MTGAKLNELRRVFEDPERYNAPNFRMPNGDNAVVVGGQVYSLTSWGEIVRYGLMRSETPPALYAFDPDIGRLAITTPTYNTAIIAVNQRAFHLGEGAGYRFLADHLIALDKLNPQTAAKMLPPLGRWRRSGPRPRRR